MLENLKDIALEKAHQQFNKFLEFADTRWAYGLWLFNTRRYVELSVPTTIAVASRYKEHELAGYLFASAQEELDHEKTIDLDLKELEIPLHEYFISPMVATFVQGQRKILESQNPIEMLLGRMVILEGSGPTEADVEIVRSRFNLSTSHLRSFYEHAHFDNIHGPKLFEVIKTSNVDEDKVNMAALETAQLFRDHWKWMLAKCTARAEISAA